MWTHSHVKVKHKKKHGDCILILSGQQQDLSTHSSHNVSTKTFLYNHPYHTDLFIGTHGVTRLSLHYRACSVTV